VVRNDSDTGHGSVGESGCPSVGSHSPFGQGRHAGLAKFDPVSGIGALMALSLEQTDQRLPEFRV